MFIIISLKAQSTIQTVREEIVDQESSTPLPGANVVIIESDLIWGSVTDADGNFHIDNVPPARMISGYAPDEITRASYLNKNTLTIASTLNHKFNAQHHLQTSYLKSDPPTFQKDLFIKDISLKSVAFRRAVIAPALLMVAGLSTLDADNDDNYEIQGERNRYIPNFRHRADDYLQHAPIVVVYGLNWLGVEGKNDFANRTAILIKSELMLGMLTFSLKRITAVPRPDTKELTSFPSGHTAQAFATATFLAKEYGHKSVWYSIGAYTLATGIGTMRVMNNRHWMSDVLVGAGIGILSTNLAYLTHQYRWGKKNKGGQTIVMPSYDGQTGMVNIIHRIN
ncbi:phosphatase PAP2 family protein [Chryseolinea sp. H1M3-3]|uniref:phosphatase PAP2 family protein n=1 Tax=Chryseolinea sp. H1M3-3 TaxID=3034144 RepID=UPI0023EDF54E|nr:phosphatase PAP2 family protein [Chryseolinea sp. H1M3-3]